MIVWRSGPIGRLYISIRPMPSCWRLRFECQSEADAIWKRDFFVLGVDIGPVTVTWLAEWFMEWSRKAEAKL